MKLAHLLLAGTVMIVPESDTNPIIERGCVVRFDTLNGAGTKVVPRVLDDYFHHCVGVTSIYVDTAGNLAINNTGGTNEIVFVVAEEDETLVDRNITCGPSGGGTITVVACYQNGNRIRVDSLAIYGAGSNLWMYWAMWDD